MTTFSTPSTIEIGRPGYLLAFTSSVAQSPVWFDAVKVTFYKGAVLEENHYYPFGLTLNSSSVSSSEKNSMKYNSKELQSELGLNWYDYGARMMDMQIGRWSGVDLLADRYPGISPYTYVMNNPVRAIDPDGRLVLFINGLRLGYGAREQSGDNPGSGRLGGRVGIYRTDVFNYWSSDKNGFGQKADIAGTFQDRIGDHNAYFTSGSSQWNSNVSDRFNQGINKARQFHNMVQSGRIDMEEGETINPDYAIAV